MTDNFVQTAYTQLQNLNRVASYPFKFSDAVRIDSKELQVTVKKGRRYYYKFFIRYDYGSDTYSTRFGYLDKKTLNFFITKWSHDVHVGELLTSLQYDYSHLNTLEYHNINNEDENDEIIEQETTNDYEEMLRFAGWIS